MGEDSKQNLLMRIIQKISNQNEAEKLFNAILTPSERDKVEERLRIFKALIDKRPQRQIAQELNVSITSVSRGARVLKYEEPFLKDILEKLDD